MTIGFLLNTCEPFYRGGYERRAWAFARELARQGHDVRVYTSCPCDETIDGVRFVRLAKSVVLAHQLRQTGTQELRARFERLLASEARTLLPPADTLARTASVVRAHQ